MNIAEIWEQFKAALMPLIERRVVEAEEWDGSPSRWPDTESYCRSCLIDVNAAAGREEKAQAYCMLPVRNPGDDPDTYVMPAVFAAAAGRGIGRVEKPDDVPEDAWNAAKQAAARKLIDAYRQMDREAPASLYQIADLEPPRREQRAMGGRMAVYRTADGRYRWAGVACTAFLNRSGEIDSTTLFDDFVTQFRENAAILDFYHVDNTRLGRVDFLAREGLALLAGGTFDDTPAAQAAARRLSADSSGWGLSIAYQPTSPPVWLEAGGSIVPVYRAGVLRAVSVLPEGSAAALYTEIEAVVERVGDAMRPEVRKALEELVGPELAAETEQRVDGINARAQDPGSGLVFRQVDPEVVAALAETVKLVQDEIAKLQTGLAAIGQAVEAIQAAETERAKRFEALEAWQHDMQKREAAEMPVVPPSPSFRPSAGGKPGAAPLEPDLSIFQNWKK